MKVLTTVAAALVGGALAVGAVIGVANGVTSAPDKNPAQTSTVVYGK